MYGIRGLVKRQIKFNEFAIIASEGGFLVLGPQDNKYPLRTALGVQPDENNIKFLKRIASSVNQIFCFIKD